MPDKSEWVAWVQGARTDDTNSKEELKRYFAPFVHAGLLSRVAHHAARPVVPVLLDGAISRLSALPNDEQFGQFILHGTRVKAADFAKQNLATQEQTHPDALVVQGRRMLSAIRELPEPQREVLLMRVLEGIPGFEIAEVTAESESQVRQSLEQGVTALARGLGQDAKLSPNDPYLWGLAGTPSAFLVTLENALTPLRFDFSVDGGPEVTPLTATPLRESPLVGRKPTPSPMPSFDPENTSPTGPGTDENTIPSGAALKPLEAPKPGSRTTGQQRALVPPPAGAQPPPANPFGTSVKTIAATDLPASADFSDIPANAATTVGLEPVAESPRASAVNPIEPSVVAGQRPSGKTGSQPRLGGPVPATSAETRARPSRPTGSKGPIPQDVVLSDSLADEIDAPPTRIRKPGQSQSGETQVPASLQSRPPSDPQKEKPTAAMSSRADWKAMGAWNAPEMMTGVIPGGTLKDAREKKGLTRHAAPFMVAAGLTLVAVVVAWLTLRGSERAVQRGWTLSPVMVASHDLPEGTTLTFDMVSQRAVPEQFVTPSVVKPDAVNYLVNQKLVVPVQAGDPLMWTQFEASRATQRLSTRVSKRARAVAIPVSNPSSVGNWVQPSDHVDVVATVPDKTAKGKKVAVTVLRDVIVLTTGKLTTTSNLSILSPTQRTYSHVSLMLVPEEAEILTLANEVADLSLTLRNEEDLEVDYEHHKTDIDTLLSGERTRLLQSKRFKTIQIIRAAPKETVGEPVKPKNN